jgi:cyclase
VNAVTDEVVIIDYGMGNIGSIANMMKKIDAPHHVSGDPEVIARARRIILPGVGAFDHGMRALETRGLLPILNQKALRERVPILGICLGMQLFTRRSDEGVLPGLGWIDAETRRFQFEAAESRRVPHMGWNTLHVRQPHAVLSEAADPWRFYFVHSYHVCCASPQDVLATADYGFPFVAAVAHDNLIGAQFHPEKSHCYGMKLLKQFVEWQYAPSAGKHSTQERLEERIGTEQPRLAPRVIPCLLLKQGGLVKTVGFRRPKYVGDPINAVKIFNDKKADELAFLDIAATVEGRSPDFDLIQRIAGEAFMPVAYGGGVQSVDDVRRIVQLGVEKVVINSQAVADRSLLRAAAEQVGSQSVVVAIDVKRGPLGGYKVCTHSGTRSTRLDPADFACEAVQAGAGEIVVNSIDRDGAMKGYDLTLIQRVAAAVNVPVIALGGASCVNDFAAAVYTGGAAAVAAGSLFVFHGKHRAVLITYPDRSILESAFSRNDACRKSAAVA